MDIIIYNNYINLIKKMTDYELVAGYIEKHWLFVINNGGMIFLNKYADEHYFVDAFLYYLVDIFGIGNDDFDLHKILIQWFESQKIGERTALDIYKERCKNPDDLGIFYRTKKLEKKMKGVLKYIQ